MDIGEVTLPLLEQLYDEFAIVNLQGIITCASNKLKNRLKVTDLSDKSILEFIPLYKQKELYAVFDSLNTIKSIKYFELHLFDTLGEIFSVKVNFRKFLDDKKKPYIFISFVSDSKEDIQQELLRLKSIIEQSPLAIIITDTDGNIIFVNNAFEKISGYSKAEALNRNPRFMKSGQTPKEIYSSLWATISSGKTWKGELFNKRKNGDFFWESTTISPIFGEGEKITHFVAIKEDITLRKKIIERLAESDERIRFIVEATGDVLYKFNYADEIYEYMNPAIVKMTGYTVDELNKIKLSSIVQEVDVAKDTKSQSNPNAPGSIYGKKGDYRAEYYIKTKDGHLKWIEDHSYPWYDEKNLIFGSVGILSEITERKEIEAQLTKAKNDAETMNHLKDVFLSNMSHELRTPMISILGYADILKEVAVDPEIKEISGVIHQSAIRLTDTINMILDLSMLEVDNLFLQFKSINIVKVLEKYSTLYTDKAHGRNLYFRNECVRKEIMIQADTRLLDQVVDNIINNAIKYTREGGITVNAYTENNQAIIVVSDTGIGIKPEHFNIIFEEFRQVSEGLDRRYEGSGLGLNISKRFVEKMSGNVWVTSEFGEGSKFFISFPIHNEN